LRKVCLDFPSQVIIERLGIVQDGTINVDLGPTGLAHIQVRAFGGLRGLKAGTIELPDVDDVVSDVRAPVVGPNPQTNGEN